MPRPDKVEIVERLSKLFDESNSFFVTDYQGLNVTDMTVLRKKLRGSKVKYVIAKNTLYKLAAHKSGYNNCDEFFTGPTAVAFSLEDPSVAAKILHDTYKEKELPRVKVFVVEKERYEGEDIKRLADLPSREILLSQLVAAVESPLSSLVGSLDAVFSELIRTIDALEAQKKG
ncbi:MAG: 50S ribosomal protein L10 [Candidatus Zixiibacteriota bacterium]